MINELLTNLNNWHATGTGVHPWSYSLSDSDWRVSLLADRVETMSISLKEFSLSRSNLHKEDSNALKTWAEKIVERTTGLLESLRVIEIDTHLQQAILRSDKPMLRGEQKWYYEVTLFGTYRADLKRFCFDSADLSREAQPFVLTQETIVKWVGDLIETAPAGMVGP